MAHLLDSQADRGNLGGEGPAANSSCEGKNTDDLLEDLAIVVVLAGGRGPFSAAELDVIERYMADILDEVLG